MILHMYSLKNRLSGIYESPISQIYDEQEYPELLNQSLALAPVADLNRHKEFDVYCVGSFDSKSGIITSFDARFVCSLESICLHYLSLKEGADDGAKESVAS